MKSSSIHPFGILLCKGPGMSVRYYYDYKSSALCNHRKGSFMEKYHAVAWQLNPSGVCYHAEELLWGFQSSAAKTAPRPQAGKHSPVASGPFLLHPGNCMEFKIQMSLEVVFAFLHWAWIPDNNILLYKFLASFFIVREWESTGVSNNGKSTEQLVPESGDYGNVNRCF